MLDTYFRKPYQKILVDPCLKLVLKTSIQPQTLTLWALACGVSIFPALSLGWTHIAFVLLIFSGYLDTLDGSVARARNLSSPQGAMLDILSDRIVECAIIFGLYAAHPEHAWICLFMLGSVLICVTTFLVSGIFIQNTSQKSFHYSPGLMERTEAFILFGMMIVFPEWFPILGSLFASVVFLTGCIRAKQFIKL